MITATCIQKFKKNNKIYGYRLQDSQGNTKDVTSDKLKQAIKSGKITILNLTLTSDNRLVDTTPTQQSQTQAPQISEEQKIKNMIAKAKMLGLPVKAISTECNHKCILISKSKTQHIIYITDDVTRLNKDYSSQKFTDNICELVGNIEVIGGKWLQDANHMFCRCQAKSIDLSSFDTSKVTDMNSMFEDCQAQSLDLSSLDTSNVITMEDMFTGCKAQSINLSSFNTSNVTDMCNMFFECQAQSLDLSSFDTSNVTDMNNMFYECKAKSIDLSSFNTSNVKYMSDMFYECQAQFLDLSSFNTSNVTNMGCMFAGCKAKSLDLSSFDTSEVYYMEKMFEGCQAQIKATDRKILEAYQRR